jgi:hypothetical protein
LNCRRDSELRTTGNPPQPRRTNTAFISELSSLVKGYYRTVVGS